MFVFDVSQTEKHEGSPPLPPEIEHPFRVSRGHVCGEYQRTIENGKRDGIRVTEHLAGSQSAGEIGPVAQRGDLQVLEKLKPAPTYVRIPIRYELLLNSNHSEEDRYATLAHELAHLYCGHLGTPSQKWWPDRRGLNGVICELEAESVSYLICRRLGLETPSERYLFQHVEEHEEAPPISLDCILKSAGLIEQMGSQRLQLRKESGV